jgi:hypothetical protein
MKRVQRKKSSIILAEPEGEVIRALQQFLQQQKMQTLKQPAADMHLTYAGIKQQGCSIFIADKNKIYNASVFHFMIHDPLEQFLEIRMITKSHALTEAKVSSPYLIVDNIFYFL